MPKHPVLSPTTDQAPELRWWQLDNLTFKLTKMAKRPTDKGSERNETQYVVKTLLRKIDFSQSFAEYTKYCK